MNFYQGHTQVKTTNLQILQDTNNPGFTPQIFFKNDPLIGNNKNKKVEPMKVKIKYQPGDIDSETVSIYDPIFKTGTAKALPKYPVLLNKTLKGNNLMTEQQRYTRTKDPLTLIFFEQKAHTTG